MRRSAALLLLLLAAMSARGARAQQPGDGGAGPVDYSEIDAATFRVFSIGTVGLGELGVRGETIRFAETNAGHGTGFAVGANGLLVTARHVIDGNIHVVVRHPGEGGFSAARVVYESEEDDIAVLWIDRSLAPLPLTTGGEPLRVRQTVFAVGYPLDPTRAFAQSAQGIIAGHLEDGTIQIDMDVNPGNSGGPLIDQDDRVIGMIVARADVGRGAQGIGYAIPVEALARAVDEANRRVTAGQLRPLSDRENQSAVVVDDLIQRGALRSLSDASDLEDGLKSDNIEQALGELGRGIEDPDLLAFIAGNLWNVSLVLRYGNIREIGKTTFTAEEVVQLGDRLADAAMELCRSAAKLDVSLARRSEFVTLALGPSGPPGSSPGARTGVAEPWKTWPRRGFYLSVGLGAAAVTGSGWSAVTDQCPACRWFGGTSATVAAGYRLSERFGLYVEGWFTDDTDQFSDTALYDRSWIRFWSAAAGLQVWSSGISLQGGLGMVGLNGKLSRDEVGFDDVSEGVRGPALSLGLGFGFFDTTYVTLGAEAQGTIAYVGGEAVGGGFLGVVLHFFGRKRPAR